MLYMVEMDFSTEDRETEWNKWYAGHLRKLLSIQGFHASQRLRAEGRVRSPYLAVYEVDGPEVFDSEAYSTRAGRDSTGEWQELMHDWHRNLFEGMRELPLVSMESSLLVIDRATESESELPGGLVKLRCIGLDRTVVERGVAVMDPHAARALAASVPLFSRVFRPLMPAARNPSGRASA